MDTITVRGSNGFALITEKAIIGANDDELFFVNEGNFTIPAVRPANVEDALASCGPSVARIPLSQITSVRRVDSNVSPWCDPPNYKCSSLPSPADAEVALDLLYNLNPGFWRREQCKTQLWLHYAFPLLAAVFVSCMATLAFMYSEGNAPNVIGKNRRRAGLLAAVAQALGPIGVGVITVIAAVGLAVWFWKERQTYLPYFTVLESVKTLGKGAE